MIDLRFKIIFSFIIFSVIFISCTKNPCEKSIKESSKLLSETTKSYISNYINTKKIIFTNNSGEEIAFFVSEIIDSMATFSKEIICSEDLSQYQIVEGKNQYIELSLSNPKFEKPLIISLVEQPEQQVNSDKNEKILITYGKISDISDQKDILLVHYTLKENIYSIVKDSVTIDGKIYYNIIEKSNTQNKSKIEVKYSKNFGIIYLKDNSTNIEYIYKRKE